MTIMDAELTPTSNWTWLMLAKFLRLDYLGVAVIFPLIGAASAVEEFTVFRLVGILAGALAFHLYVSLLNDIVDLPLDRANPARSNYPLVSGDISLATAYFIVLSQIPIAAAVVYWQVASRWAYGAMALALGMMTIYNVWGKRSAFPISMDIIQGAGFSALALYGAALVGELTRLSWLVFALGVIWMVIVNFLGGLRDLRGDFAFGVNTTPIYLGIRPADESESIPAFARFYGYALHGVIIVGGIILVISSDYSLGVKIALLASSVLLNLLAALMLATIFASADKSRDPARLDFFFRYIGLSALGLFSPLLPALPLWATLAVLAAFFLSYQDYDIKGTIEFWTKRQ